MALKLQILICTFGRRIENVDAAGMPRVDGVEYVVCCQNPDGLPLEGAAPALEARHDVRIAFFADRGLSINRNHALDIASAPYVMIADDDLSWDAEGLREVIRRFDADPGLDILTTCAVMPERRVYPPDGHDLSRPWRFYSAISFEFTYRLAALRSHGLRFSPLAGIGAPVLGAGEEDLLLQRSLEAGLRGRFADIRVVTHDGPTTSVHSAADPRVIRALAAVARRRRGNIATLIRMPLMAWRVPAPFLSALRYLAEGFVYSLTHRSEL